LLIFPILITLSLFLIILVFIFSFFFLWSLSTRFFIFIVISCFSPLNLSIILILILFVITSPWSIRSSLVDVLATRVWPLNLIDWCRIFRYSFSFFSINKLLLCLRSSRSINFCSHLDFAFSLHHGCLRSLFSFINFLRSLVLLLRSFLDNFDFFSFFRFNSLIFLFLLLCLNNFRKFIILFGLKNLFNFRISSWCYSGIFLLPLLFSLSSRLFVFHGVSKLKTSPRRSKQILNSN